MSRLKVFMAKASITTAGLMATPINVFANNEDGPAAQGGIDFDPDTILNAAGGDTKISNLTDQAKGITKEIVSVIIAIGIMIMVGSVAFGAIQYAAGGTGQKSDAGKSRITKACIGAFLIGCAVSGIAWLVGQGQGVWD